MFCKNCGVELEVEAKFCAFCGTSVNVNDSIEHRQQDASRPIQKIQHVTIRQKAIQNQLEYFSFLKFILLSVVTLGIYNVITLYRFTNTVNKLCEEDEEESPNYVIVILLGIITCGIYTHYWIYKQANRLLKAAPRYGCRINESSTKILLWSTFGTFILIGPLVAWHKIFDISNILIRSYNKGKRQVWSVNHFRVSEKSKKPIFIIAGFYLGQIAVLLLLFVSMFGLFLIEGTYSTSDYDISESNTVSINDSFNDQGSVEETYTVTGVSLNNSNISQYYGTYKDRGGAILEIGYMGNADRQRIHFYGFGDYSNTASVIGAGYLVSDYNTGDTGIWISAYSDGSLYVDDKDSGVYTGTYYPMNTKSGTNITEGVAESAGNITIAENLGNNDISIEPYVDVTTDELLRNPQNFVEKKIRIYSSYFIIMLGEIYISTENGYMEIQYDKPAYDVYGEEVGNVLDGDEGYIEGVFVMQDGMFGTEPVVLADRIVLVAE